MWLLFEKEANDAAEFFMSLEKEPQQEDFLQGRMLGNPYSSTEPGLGPLMRDVKNKICQGWYLLLWCDLQESLGITSSFFVGSIAKVDCCFIMPVLAIN